MTLKFLSIALLLMASISTFSQELPPIENGVSQKLAIWRAANYRDVRYKLNLIIEKKAPTLKGTIEISLQSKSNKIILDWRTIKGSENLSKISNVSINGKSLILNPKQPGAPVTRPLVYDHSNEHLIFAEGVIIGENVIKLDFESPILTSGGAITRYIDKEDGAEYIYSLFVPSDASTAFPVFDQPDLKARFKFSVYKPDSWKAKIITNIGAGNISSSKIGYSTFDFDETPPISTYVFAFAIGEFSQFLEGVKEPNPSDKQIFNAMYPNGGNQNPERLSFVYVRKSQAEKFKPHAEEVFRLNRETIKYLEDYFDYKFPFPKYDLVLIPEFPFGGMEHAGATFLRESAVIFPTEPTANNYISRANLIFHENAHQWFGDTVTMKWFDDLWLKEGFATFMAYKAMEKVLPQYNAWKVFYERTKPLAYQTDVTRGTTPIYQEIPNLNSAKSAYGNIVYQKAPGFLRQAEFYLGEKDFQTAVRAFLKKHEFANAEWSDLVGEFENASGRQLNLWAKEWVIQRGVPVYRPEIKESGNGFELKIAQRDVLNENKSWNTKFQVKVVENPGKVDESFTKTLDYSQENSYNAGFGRGSSEKMNLVYVFPNYQDYGYGIFLLDEKSKKYILKNIQNEKDDFLRSMMWGSLWDSVRFSELSPIEYINLAINQAAREKDVTTISSILARVNTAFTYYLSERQQAELAPRLEKLFVKEMNSKSRERQITFYRAFLNIASTPKAQAILKSFLNAIEKESKVPKKKSASEDLPELPLRTKDKFDIVTKLIILGDKDARKLLARLEKTETDDDAKRYAYAAKAGFAPKENKARFWEDFVNNKEISESWIEEAIDVWNSPSQAALTLPYLEKALAELPNLKRNRKIFFVNGWLSAFIGGQKNEAALRIVNKFLADNPELDLDLKRKILEVLDGLERAVAIRKKYSI